MASFREMNLNVFSGAPNPHVFFQPRITSWIGYKRMHGGMDLPPAYQQMDLRDLHRELNVSMRYLMDYTPPESPIELRFDPQVRITNSGDAIQRVRTLYTPHGELSEEFRFTDDGFWRQTEFMVKSAQDLPAFRWLLDHMHYEFSIEKFEIGETYMGDLGEPQFYLPKSPYQAMAQSWSELLPLTYLLHDRREEMERIFDQVDVLSDQLYQQLADYGRARIINIGENLHQALLSPRYFERYYIPYYERRLAQLHAGGMYCHIHIDGDFHQLLPYLKQMSFDGYEALTPTPQGDVTLEEMRDAIGGKVLLDGIPAIYFLPNVPREVLVQCVETLHAYFSPRLVLGASDEVPQGCDSLEAIERVKMIARWCREHQ
ncbi:MAG: hypothetical protein HPY85_15505 [Anaerolineae bacterium]|nr:hypothetical protein [Anaerolineae bacterium]